MRLSKLQSTWNTLGTVDAMWAIITEDPHKLGHHWDSSEFFRTGQQEIDAVMSIVASVAPNLQHVEALDFGCGVGRLTRALANYFDRVSGVDIAPSMIDQAHRLNDLSNCNWILNDKNDLRIFDNECFNLVYTDLVLQHMRPAYARDYIREFTRVTAIGGLMVFQIPDGTPGSIRRKLAATVLPLIMPFVPARLLQSFRARRYPNAPAELLKQIPKRHMEMHGIPKADVVALMASLGAPVIRAEQTNGAGEDWASWRYYALKTS